MGGHYPDPRILPGPAIGVLAQLPGPWGDNTLILGSYLDLQLGYWLNYQVHGRQYPDPRILPGPPIGELAQLQGTVRADIHGHRIITTISTNYIN